jgi:hypothetical protein
MDKLLNSGQLHDIEISHIFLLHITCYERDISLKDIDYLLRITLVFKMLVKYNYLAVPLTLHTEYCNVFLRHLQSFADLWPTLMGFSIYI